MMRVLLGAFLAALSGVAMAAGGENVRLVFTDQDKIFLYISLAAGLIAIVGAIGLSSGLKKLSSGDEKMQEVGDAIEAGAMAYLRKQITAMLPFVLLIAGLLIAMYFRSYGTTLSIFVAVSFIGGVAASYIAGYAGMRMAVKGNTRTANAALTSYGRSLETAFRSGAVAGLVTVGMGLIGATAIFLLAGSDAMKLLVGFGFGGSLAALFMRVGGGIYTKAADVGADLVGKVEAGIPEDDPRNPATIADNVGDNVGDCAGMAADVFESYEVTLVAAIVLGAATSAIFDQSTWMKLIIFALLARGVGILASLIGIYTVKGSDDLNSDPLTPIRSGFYRSAFIALVGTAAVAYLLMGGQAGTEIRAANLQSQAERQQEVFDLVKKEQRLAAAEKAKKPVAEVTEADLAKVEPADMRKSAVIKELGLDKQEQEFQLSGLLRQPLDQRPANPRSLAGFAPVSLSDSKNPVLNYTLVVPPEDATQPNQEQQYISVRDFLKDVAPKLRVWEIEVRNTPPASGPEKPQEQVNKSFFGPIEKDRLEKLIKNATAQNNSLKVTIVPGQDKPAILLADKNGKLAMGYQNVDINKPINQLAWQLSYYKEDAATVKKAMDAAKTDPQNAQAPTAERMEAASLKFYKAEWWRFLLCIAFGLVMAVFFEMLTDHYVSFKKKPVREVADVATAGPAPMIIQGFSYGLESSVMSVLAIVLALFTPLLIFPPEAYGGYLLSFYGIALVGLGLLTTTGYILAMDTFGPISDNAQGVFEMSGAGHNNADGARAVQLLDAAGNTTKALTKGFAIATAVVAAVALFHSYVEEAKLTELGMRLEVPEIFLGLLIGGAAPFLFSAFSINAVGRAAFALINEVRRQFREDAGIMAGTSKPDYGRCVAIVTSAAQKELLGPGILAIFLPVAVAFGFSIGKPNEFVGGAEFNLVGAQALGGFLAGTILSGQLMAVLLANSGGMWDNAKKLIEDGMHGGKGTDAHKAAVVCDTVGDPFKDTAGPALNPLIKVMNLVALLLAPTIIQPMSDQTRAIITGVSVLFLIGAFIASKKGSMSSGMNAAAAETNN